MDHVERGFADGGERTLSGGSAPTDFGERLLTPVEVAARLQVNVKWVYAAARRGDVPHLKLGRYVRFDRDDIERWIVAQKSSFPEQP